MAAIRFIVVVHVLLQCASPAGSTKCYNCISEKYRADSILTYLSPAGNPTLQIPKTADCDTEEGLAKVAQVDCDSPCYVTASASEAVNTYLRTCHQNFTGENIGNTVERCYQGCEERRDEKGGSKEVCTVQQLCNADLCNGAVDAKQYKCPPVESTGEEKTVQCAVCEGQTKAQCDAKPGPPCNVSGGFEVCYTVDVGLVMQGKGQAAYMSGCSPTNYYGKEGLFEQHLDLTQQQFSRHIVSYFCNSKDNCNKGDIPGAKTSPSAEMMKQAQQSGGGGGGGDDDDDDDDEDDGKKKKQKKPKDGKGGKKGEDDDDEGNNKKKSNKSGKKDDDNDEKPAKGEKKAKSSSVKLSRSTRLALVGGVVSAVLSMMH